MYKSITRNLREWNELTDPRQKLQHLYLIVAFGLILAAGIIGLINYDLGQRVLLGAFIAVIIFIVNAVAWALLQSFVLLRLPEPRDTATKKPTRAASSRRK